jgi:hypothetical protein
MLLREDHYRDNGTDGRRHERLPRLFGTALVAKSDLCNFIVNSLRIQAVSTTIDAFANARRRSSNALRMGLGRTVTPATPPVTLERKLRRILDARVVVGHRWCANDIALEAGSIRDPRRQQRGGGRDSDLAIDGRTCVYTYMRVVFIQTKNGLPALTWRCMKSMAACVVSSSTVSMRLRFNGPVSVILPSEDE